MNKSKYVKETARRMREENGKEYQQEKERCATCKMNIIIYTPNGCRVHEVGNYLEKQTTKFLHLKTF